MCPPSAATSKNTQTETTCVPQVQPALLNAVSHRQAAHGQAVPYTQQPRPSSLQSRSPRSKLFSEVSKREEMSP